DRVLLLLLAFAAKARPGHRFQARFRDRLSRRWSLNLNSSIRLRSRLYGFHTGTRSLWNRKGRGRRSGGREREPRRAGEGRVVWNRNYTAPSANIRHNQNVLRPRGEEM